MTRCMERGSSSKLQSDPAHLFTIDSSIKAVAEIYNHSANTDPINLRRGPLKRPHLFLDVKGMCTSREVIEGEAIK